MPNSQTVFLPSEQINNSRRSRRIAQLSFPNDNSTHALIMQFKKYNYRGGTSSVAGTSASIALPLPSNISDNIALNISASQIGIVGAGASEIIAGRGGNLLSEIQSATQSAGQEAARSVTGGLENLQANLSNASASAAYLARAVGGGISPEVGQGISAASGTAINPHTTLLFDGANLKVFSFDWTLSPRDESEMETISDIINTIKRRSLPSYKQGGSSSFSRGLLEYPDLVEMYFTGYDPAHMFLFKQSMISNITVNYTPNGNVMNKGKNGSSPAFVNISINFTEAEIWTRDNQFTGR